MSAERPVGDAPRPDGERPAPSEKSRPASTGRPSITSSARPPRGLYEIRGLGAKRRVPNFDDLLFLAASLSRYPLEGYRERCATKTVLGTRFATQADRARGFRSPSPA